MEKKATSCLASNCFAESHTCAAATHIRDERNDTGVGKRFSGMILEDKVSLLGHTCCSNLHSEMEASSLAPLFALHSNTLLLLLLIILQ